MIHEECALHSYLERQIEENKKRLIELEAAIHSELAALRRTIDEGHRELCREISELKEAVAQLNVSEHSKRLEKLEERILEKVGRKEIALIFTAISFFLSLVYLIIRLVGR